jgi:hypothetical protein
MQYLFACRAFGFDQQVALVTMFKTVFKDGLRKVVEDKEAESTFIDLSWVERVVYAVEDIGTDMYSIVDTMDSDMYLRFLDRDILL